jgi:hypothetical protein
MRLIFSSGNMSSGVVLHHENWHFITMPSSTYFAQSHLCLMKAQLDPKAVSSKEAYTSSIMNCRSQIKAPEENDIKAFFIPVASDNVRAANYLASGISRSKSLFIAAHRFSYGRMLSSIRNRLSSAPATDVRIVADDDTYWAGHGEQVGDNGAWEYDNINNLVARGAKVKYMETNHTLHLLHHNKYLIFNMENYTAVFAGAGNLTTAAFNDNFENFYFIRIKAVADAFNQQYQHVWNDLATEEANMPASDIIPPEPTAAYTPAPVSEHPTIQGAQESQLPIVPEPEPSED